MKMKKPMSNQDIVKLCDLLDIACANAQQPEVLRLLELVGVSGVALRQHQHRLSRVEACKEVARTQPQHAKLVAELRSQLEAAESIKAMNGEKIKALTQRLAAAEASAPTEESLRVIESIAPQLASLRNQCNDREITEIRGRLARAESSLAACESALDQLSSYELMPLRVKVSQSTAKPETEEITSRLAKVSHLLTQGRAVLGIECREYRYSSGDRPATGALREFYAGGGVPGRLDVPVLFDDREIRMHGTGIMTPLADEIEKTQSEVRVAVARLQLEECELKRRQGLTVDNPFAKVYADEIRSELLAAVI